MAQTHGHLADVTELLLADVVKL